MADEPQNDAIELATLRNTVRELKDKSSTRKKRIAELETALAERDSQLASASASLKAITIDAPMKDLAQSISSAPELWTDLFNKHYRLESTDGVLKLFTIDGQPVLKDGKDVPFEREALISLLTDEKHPAAKSFAAISIVSKASGGQTQSETNSRHADRAKPKVNFGLR